LLGFDGKQARFTGLATGLQCCDLRQQVVLPLFPAHDLLFPHLVGLAHLVLPLSVVDNSFSPHRLTILLDPAYSTF
jgi:hypothetical protein